MFLIYQAYVKRIIILHTRTQTIFTADFWASHRDEVGQRVFCSRLRYYFVAECVDYWIVQGISSEKEIHEKM
jgi:hypothetical protein